MMRTLIYLLITFMIGQVLHAQEQPLRIGVIGLTHTHVHWIFTSEGRGDIEIAGIVEQDRGLAQRYADQYGFSMEEVYNTSEELIKDKKFEAVSVFGTIYDHLSVVQTFAPLGIHVMVEKPLAVNLDHARKMKNLAEKHNIHLLTNYETTWYPANHKAYEMTLRDSLIGKIRKVVVRDGHRGPIKIGVNREFLDWLTDPKLNGGGALTDFGCYGANLVTWLTGGEKPVSVTAVAHQLQEENNPKVEDEAIIIVKYTNLVAVIHGSWNWPIGRKDMEIYGLRGVVYADNRHNLRVRIAEGYDGFEENTYQLDERPAPYDDPFSYFTAVIRDKVIMDPYDLSSLENNMRVMEILEAAKRSIREGKTIYFKP